METIMRTSHTFIIILALCLLSAGYARAHMDEERCGDPEGTRISMEHSSCACGNKGELCQCDGVVTSLGHECCTVSGCKFRVFSVNVLERSSGRTLTLTTHLADPFYLLSPLNGSDRNSFTGLSPPTIDLVPVYLQNCSFLI